MVPPLAIEDLSTTTIFMMIFGLVLFSFGGGALAAYVFDKDRKKDNDAAIWAPASRGVALRRSPLRLLRALWM
eukprot:CAMPEP_0197413640 /NCGR_PEP_ID=MMETSP1170-20131217/499_1 /TAXON_ID=54406 /ORGANISM="Sarcinochrysis sp, Strain CCMP770" /LENGTH=72 /DNA_ID=CAMNT_0042940255 /DNA_START=44 /DNA_END=263 /DNA_ORIENTATION=+